MASELKFMIGAESSNVPDQAAIAEKHNKELEDKKIKDFLKKQTGMKRELIKLIGGVPTLVSKDTRKLAPYSDETKWVWSSFESSDKYKLKLYHWQRSQDVSKPYEYNKFNQKIDIIQFSEEEYDRLIKPNDSDWTYEETKYLWDLLEKYDLRFIVIHDRYDEEKYQERTIEELKDRYYSICRKILEDRKMFEHPILKSGYNCEQEMKRRNYIERTMNRPQEENAKDIELMKRAEIVQNNIDKYLKTEEGISRLIKRVDYININSNDNELNNNVNSNNNDDVNMNINLNEEEVQNNLTSNLNTNTINNNSIIPNTNTINNSNNIILPNPNLSIQPYNEQSPNTAEISTFEDYIRKNATENDSFVYLRSQKMKHNLPVSEKIQIRVENYLKDLGVSKNLIPTARVEIEYDKLRNNIVLYSCLAKYLSKKDKEIQNLTLKLEELQNKQLINTNQNNNQHQNNGHRSLGNKNKDKDKEGNNTGGINDGNTVGVGVGVKEKKRKNGTPVKGKKRKTNLNEEGSVDSGELKLKKKKKTIGGNSGGANIGNIGGGNSNNINK